MTVQHGSRHGQNQPGPPEDDAPIVQTVLILSVLAFVLVIAVLVAVAVQPLAGVAIPPVLYAVAAVIKAAGGRSR